jgi:hypothetical protein
MTAALTISVVGDSAGAVVPNSQAAVAQKNECHGEIQERVAAVLRDNDLIRWIDRLGWDAARAVQLNLWALIDSRLRRGMTTLIPTPS